VQTDVAPPANGKWIVLDRVAKRYPTRKGWMEAIRDVSLAVGYNEFVSVIGPSGCGKTTILKLVGDVLKPSAGSISVAGRPAAEARRQRAFGFVFQDPVLLPWRTVRQNVGLPLEVVGQPNRDRVDHLIELVGLAGFQDHFPEELSGGMQQRVAIARALSFDPSILLMDEPFGALDLITRDRMSFELLSIWERARKTVIFITHSIDEAVVLSDRVVVMSDRPGRLIEDVTIDLPRPRHRETRDDARFAEITRHLRRLLE
jgi:NitT/TauT family transport system ATP-binding protein